MYEKKKKKLNFYFGSEFFQVFLETGTGKPATRWMDSSRKTLAGKTTRQRWLVTLRSAKQDKLFMLIPQFHQAVSFFKKF